MSRLKLLPFSDFDLAGVATAVTLFKKAGLRADCSTADRASGMVRIVFEHPGTRDGCLVVFDIHKIAKPGWFRDRARWVVQLSSKRQGCEPITHGCALARTQAQAITAAELDVKQGFVSRLDFDAATTAS